MIKLNLLSGEINLPLPGPVKTRGAPSRLRRLWIHPPSLPDQTLLLSVHPLELHEHYIHIIYYVLGTSYTSKLRWYRTPIKANKRYPICSKRPASYSWMHCFHQHKRHKPYRSPVRGTWPIILKCIQIRNINVLNRRVYLLKFISAHPAFRSPQNHRDISHKSPPASSRGPCNPYQRQAFPTLPN